jgi:tetratricopeptide (TPR) repeat protein
MHKVTSLEDAMPLDFGPPGVVKPSHELLGELLLRAGRPDQARAEFERALRLAPQRALSLLGRARAVVAAGGDARAAARAYEELRGIWHRADPDIPGLAEATRFLAARQ